MSPSRIIAVAPRHRASVHTFRMPRGYTPFLDAAPSKDVLRGIIGANTEQVRLGAREVYVHYGAGMGQSKLKIPGAEMGTARNMNTIARLAQMAARDRRSATRATLAGARGPAPAAPGAAPQTRLPAPKKSSRRSP